MRGARVASAGAGRQRASPAFAPRGRALRPRQAACPAPAPAAAACARGPARRAGGQAAGWVCTSASHSPTGRSRSTSPRRQVNSRPTSMLALSAYLQGPEGAAPSAAAGALQALMAKPPACAVGHWCSFPRCPCCPHPAHAHMQTSAARFCGTSNSSCQCHAHTRALAAPTPPSRPARTRCACGCPPPRRAWRGPAPPPTSPCSA